MSEFDMGCDLCVRRHGTVGSEQSWPLTGLDQPSAFDILPPLASLRPLLGTIHKPGNRRFSRLLRLERGFLNAGLVT